MAHRPKPERKPKQPARPDPDVVNKLPCRLRATEAGRRGLAHVAAESVFAGRRRAHVRLLRAAFLLAVEVMFPETGVIFIGLTALIRSWLSRGTSGHETSEACGDSGRFSVLRGTSLPTLCMLRWPLF
jgi:hypothetical protein